MKEETSKAFKLYDIDGAGYIGFKVLRTALAAPPTKARTVITVFAAVAVQDLKRVATELGENMPDAEIKEIIEEVSRRHPFNCRACRSFFSLLENISAQ
jgi:Ca2+-binding EF-hand superfamily protein